jgi:KDO2-lipid IV(A) lauroyltransferase
METLLHLAAKTTVAVLQWLPLRWVVTIGRAGGALAWRLDVRHRQVALENLTAAFGHEKTPSEIRELGRENFRRIGENFACAIRTAAMPAAEILELLSVLGAEKLAVPGLADRSCVVGIGHFGNFELYARANQFVPGIQFATTYRALRRPALDRVLQGLRERSGCLFFERRTGAEALKDAMNHQRLMIGFLGDVHAGDRGIRAPFFGRDCSTSAAPAVFALRYGCPLFTAICYRVAPGRWQIEIGDQIPTRVDGHSRSVEAITRELNLAYEAAVRRDPANWFWVHRRWKPMRDRYGTDRTPVAAGTVRAPGAGE